MSPTVPSHIVGVLFLLFLSFSFVFSTPSWKWRPTLFVLELRHLFLLSSGLSKKIAKLLKKSERWPNKRSKVKTLQDKPRSGWPFFHKMCEKYYRKSCKYMCNNSTKQKGKKISTSRYRSKFRAQRHGDRLKALKRKRLALCTLHASMVSEGFANFIPKEDRPANWRDVNPLETIWINVDETTYKDPAPNTLDELRQWLRFAWKNVTLDTLWELVHSIAHRLENIRKHKGKHSGY